MAEQRPTGPERPPALDLSKLDAAAAASKTKALDPDATCWCCGGATAKRHCKIVCTNCGFMRDCSDQ